MPPLGTDFARSAAGRLGVSLGEAAAAELAVHLELHLRKVLGLALKLARRARRRRLCCTDVMDAAECGGGSIGNGPLAPWAAGLMQHCSLAAGQNRGKLASGNVVPLVWESSRRLGVAPLELSLSVEWLAVEGAAVALRPGNGPRLEELDPGGPADSAGVVLAPAPSFLAEEQTALLTRIIKILDGGEGKSGQSEDKAEDAEREIFRWRAPLLAVCRREECVPLLPFLAQYLACKVPACLADAPPAELRLLLDVLGAVALAPRGAEPLLHQCLPPALLLCLSPALGSSRRWPGESSEYHAVRRKAAGTVARITLRYCESLPEVYAEVFRVYEEALRRKPALGVAAGAAMGLAALGPRCATEVLAPALMEGLAQHLAVSALGQGQAVGDAGSGAGAAAAAGAGGAASPAIAPVEGAEPEAPAAKKARLAAKSERRAARTEMEEVRATTFSALLSAASASASANSGAVSSRGPGAKTAATHLRQAAQLCEAACAAFGTDPAPLLAAMPSAPSSGLEASGLPPGAAAPPPRRPLNLAPRHAAAYEEVLRRAGGVPVSCRSLAAPPALDRLLLQL